MRGFVFAMALVGVFVDVGHADPLDEPDEHLAVNHHSGELPDELIAAPELPPGTSLGDTLKDKANWLSGELGLHLKNLSFELLDMGWDIRRKTAYLRLDTGDFAGNSLRIDSRVRFRGNYARVKTRLDLAILGERLSLDLPEFDMLTESFQGQRIVVVRVPLLEGSF